MRAKMISETEAASLYRRVSSAIHLKPELKLDSGHAVLYMKILPLFL